MFKLVVLCAFVASAVAKPGTLVATPLVQPYAAYSTVYSPYSTSISSQSSSVIHPSPLYSSPYAYSHFIKKRSADPQFLATYNTQYGYYPYSFPTSQYLSSPILQTPVTYTSDHLPVATHLIKKRSAPLLSASYITPTTYLSSASYQTPLISSPYYQTPYYAGAQIPLFNAHFIKKRSADPTPDPSAAPSAEPSAEPSAAPSAEPSAAPSADPQTFFPTTYYSPSSYLNAYSATPYFAYPWANSYYSAAGIPLATTHLIKKRSAEAAPEPAPKNSPDLLTINTYPTTYYSGALGYSYKYPTLFKSGAYYPANPFVYSTFIKK